MGTAAGAAKSRALKREAEAVDSRMDQAPRQPDGALTVLDGADGSAVLAVQQSEQPVSVLLPDSMRLVGRVIAGKIRAPIAVRTQAALRMIELSYSGKGRGGADPAGMTLTAIAGQLAQALGVRRPRAPVTVESGADSGGDAGPAQSQQQPDI